METVVRNITIKPWRLETYWPHTIVSIGASQEHEIHNTAHALYNVMRFPDLGYTYIHNDGFGSGNVLKHAKRLRYHLDDIAVEAATGPHIIFADPFWDYGNKTNVQPDLENTFFGHGPRPKNILYVQLTTFIHAATLPLDKIDYLVLNRNTFYEKRLYEQLQLGAIFGDYQTYSDIYRKITENGDMMVLDLKGCGLDAVYYIRGYASARLIEIDYRVCNASVT